MRRREPNPAAVLSRDTSRAVEKMQVEAWRGMSTIDLGRLIAGASRAARTLALAGVRARHPNEAEDRLILRLAELTLGKPLARRVYPELEQLQEPRA